MMKNAALRQVSLPKHIHEIVKGYSRKRNVGLGELYNNWIHLFLEYRRLLPQSQQFMKYFASPKNAVPTSIQIDQKKLH